jgi:predicted membrane protein (TIGR00267 family)
MKSQVQKEGREIDLHPGREKKEVYEVYFRKGFRGRLLTQIVNKITSSKRTFLEFMVREELKFEDSDPSKAAKDALLVGVSSFVGSLIPLIPFVFLHASLGIIASVAVSIASLFVVGVIKAKTTVGSPLREGLEMALVGGLAAIAGYAVGMLLGVTLVQ